MMSEEKDRDDQKKSKKDPDIEDLDSLEQKPSKKSSKRQPRKKATIKKASERLIQDALEAHLEYQAVRNATYKKDILFLSNILDEYLENFIVLGYDYQGEAVQLVSATNQQQSDALGTAVHRFLMNNSKGAGGYDFF